MFFAPKKGQNIILPEYIEKMNQIKKKVEAIEGYTDFCTTTYCKKRRLMIRNLVLTMYHLDKGVLQCEEPQSLLQFFFPSHDPHTGINASI